MILTRDAIRREIDAGRVVIEPFALEQIGPASIDLHLGDEIRVMHEGREPVPVTDDVVFDGPLQHARGKAEFVDLTAQFLSAHRATRLLRRIADGSTVTSIFEFVVDAPNGQQLTCPVAEWATVSDGRISEFRVYYDPREFVRAFGMAD